MFRIDTAVDYTDNNVFAVQTGGAAQADTRIKQVEKVETVVRRHRTYFVFPDLQYFRHVGELVRIGWPHFCGKTVEAIAVAVNQLRVRPGTVQYRVLLLSQLL